MGFFSENNFPKNFFSAEILHFQFGRLQDTDLSFQKIIGNFYGKKF